MSKDLHDLYFEAKGFEGPFSFQTLRPNIYDGIQKDNEWLNLLNY